MPIPYEQLYSSRDTHPGLPYMRLPSYKSLRCARYHPYPASRARSSTSPADMTESAEDTDLEADVFLPCANSNSVPLSLSMLLEDDCMDGLRTLVSQMIGRDSTQMRLGSVHLVIDFALLVRRYRRESGMAVRDGSAM